MKRLALLILALGACSVDGEFDRRVCLDIHRPENHGQPGHDHEIQEECFGEG